MTTHELKRRTLSAFENEILNLINERDEFTTSDLQGMVSVVVEQIAREAVRIQQTESE